MLPDFMSLPLWLFHNTERFSLVNNYVDIAPKMDIFKCTNLSQKSLRLCVYRPVTDFVPN